MNPFDRARTSEVRKTLVIIDMQTGFIGGLSEQQEKETTNVICKMIEHARQQKWGIMIVEFDGYGETIDSIAQMVDGYELAYDVVKDHMGVAKKSQRVLMCAQNCLVILLFAVSSVNSACRERYTNCARCQTSR